MGSGERPIGAAKGKQSDTEALCQPPPPPDRDSGPQRVRMSSGERPIGTAKGKQPNTEALCQTPPPTSDIMPLQMYAMVPPPPCDSSARVRTTAGVVSVTLGTASYFALFIRSQSHESH